MYEGQSSCGEIRSLFCLGAWLCLYRWLKRRLRLWGPISDHFSIQTSKFHICCLLSDWSPVPCGLWEAGLNWNETGKLKGPDLISSGLWSEWNQNGPLALFWRWWPITLHRKLYVNDSVIPQLLQVFHFIQCHIKLLLLHQDLIEFYESSFHSAFSWIF